MRLFLKYTKLFFERLLLPAIYFLILLSLLSCQRKTRTSETINRQVFKHLDNNLVIALNHLTYTIANEHDYFLSFIGVRALTMTHLAVHDAFNAIENNYEPYAYKGSHPQADPTAAAAQATKTVLSAIYQDRSDTINLICDQWLATIEEGTAKQLGLELGSLSARAIIKMRAGDGHEKQGDYTPMTKPGDYQYTPEFDWVWKPDFSYAKPFTLDSVTQFRSPDPPALNSKKYADSYNEVKTYGARNSKVRSEDQTNYAHWWAEFAEHSWNRIGRITAKERNLGVLETARMFALVNMNIYDTYLVSFDSKYHYDTWRPYTAIRAGDQDGNKRTEADPAWVPEMLTPPWPEYPSAHAAVGGGGAEIIAYVYGTPEVIFTMESITALPNARTRTYTNVFDAALKCAESRIMNGFHFRFATDEGLKQGMNVANHVCRNFLRPVSGGG